MTPWRDLGLSAPLDKGQIGPDARMVGGLQCRVSGTGGVEAYSAGMDGQWSRHPDIIDTPIKPGPIRMGHAAISVLQGGIGRGGSLGRAKDAGHELSRGHLQGGIEVATPDPCLNIVTRLDPGQ
jgi:hypothetical protein